MLHRLRIMLLHGPLLRLLYLRLISLRLHLVLCKHWGCCELLWWLEVLLRAMWGSDVRLIVTLV